VQSTTNFAANAILGIGRTFDEINNIAVTIARLWRSGAALVFIE
jgi:hypothetical protein